MSMLMSLCFSSGNRIDVLTLCNTLLSGLVAITGGCDVIDPPAALAIGVIASLVYQGVSAICVRYELDDVVDAFAVHGANGLWGLIAIGLFHRSEGLFMGGGIDLLGKQLVGALAIGSFSFVITFFTAVMLNKLNWLRVSPEIEVNGLDSEFGLMAYVTKSQSLRRCDAVARLVAQKGYTEMDVLESLRKLRGIVYRPFTPQAADFKLEDALHSTLPNTELRAVR
ncbi:hypothetical protein AB1Y20_019995 [Prymnesium parvum]|uniref:Ammonium transporter AmtB-like domain-containing protein n=1 Tax=Prymnesium parvum TaxID=97485 RepID=A0AB34JSF0_PRYPA